MKQKKRVMFASIVLSTWLVLAPITHAQEIENEISPAETGEAAQNDDIRRRAQDRANEAKEKAKANVESKKADIKEKLAGKRLDVCNERKETINKRIDSRAKSLEARVERIRVLQEKVQSYATENALPIAGTEYLSATANAAYEKAVQDVATAASIKLECAAENANGQIGGSIKMSFRTAQASVKSYKNAVKAIFQATKNAEASDEQ